MEDRGINSIDYFTTYSLMINAAQHKGFTTYQEIAQAIGVETRGNNMQRIVSNLLELVSRNEVGNERPMLSAIAVSVSDKPREGFYRLAIELGLLVDSEDKISFWEAECKKVYDTWKKRYLTH